MTEHVPVSSYQGLGSVAGAYGAINVTPGRAVHSVVRI